MSMPPEDCSAVEPLADSGAKPDLLRLCQRLGEQACEVDRSGQWPDRQLRACVEAGVFGWFIPREFGGWGWSELEILDGYLALSQRCLTTTFILTQWNAACRRILGSSNAELKNRILPAMASGDLFATVGISHLSTSRQHVAKPVMQATQQPDGGYLLNGFSPWVTGAAHADLIVVGATLEDGRQLMSAVPSTRPGVRAESGQSLMALTGSRTDQVHFEQVHVAPQDVVAGPIENVLKTNSGGGTGGLQTSTLAVGLSMAAVQFLREQAERRADLVPIADRMQTDVHDLCQALRQLTLGQSVMEPAELRRQANSLVMRTTQAALSASKGAGFVTGHPAGRWAREALFFLVWSCPQPVVEAQLCEFAQISSS